MDSKVLHKKNRISFFASYEEPESHRHFAKHIIVAKEPFRCTVGDEVVLSNSVFIKSLEPHQIEYINNSEVFVMLIDGTSDISKVIDDVYLKGKKVEGLPRSIYQSVHKYITERDLAMLDAVLVDKLFSAYQGRTKMDPRIQDVVHYIETIDTIEAHLFKQMANMIFLSESRFSHLFKSEMGIDFKNYLLMKKFEKTYMYVIEDNMSITEASIKAGFSSSSHFATVCKKQFGISLRSFMNSLQ